MEPHKRCNALRALLKSRPEVALCRDVEAAIHAVSATEEDYTDLLLRACFNLRANLSETDPSAFVHASDAHLSKGTLLERIERESHAREERFRSMLKEKYDDLNDVTYEAIVRCRRCGSSEVSWEEKQTRSADEAATVFCVCDQCKNRWVMR